MHCTSDKFTVGRLWVERNVIDDDPVYQRESAVWSDEKQQLFLDSVFNDYDIPKVYLHDLRGQKGKHHFAIVDGKQRLHTIWRFINGEIKLADDVKIATTGSRKPPKPGCSFEEMDEEWRDLFKSKPLDVVLIQDANEQDIEELFSRLNNGEPLNAAEKRNAMGGDMCELVRKVAGHSFFKTRPGFPNDRYQHREIAARLLLIEHTIERGADMFCDLKKRHLDNLVKTNKKLTESTNRKLYENVDSELRAMTKVFSKSDALLKKQAWMPIYYLFVKLMIKEYAHPQLHKRLHSFLADFQVARNENLAKPEDARDSVLVEFEGLTQQATADQGNLRRRASIMRRYFLKENPEVEIKDTRRVFSEEERIVIFLRAKQRCEACGKAMELDEMDADHQERWAVGGKTTLKNARALCTSCNRGSRETLGD